MATPSRRTPPALTAAVRDELGDGFLWDGSGENPYAAMLALADAILVTGDSANMVGEATATGAPVHVFEPSGGGSKKLAQRDRRADRARRGAALGRTDREFRYAPIDSSGEIAARNPAALRGAARRGARRRLPARARAR